MKPEDAKTVSALQAHWRAERERALVARSDCDPSKVATYAYVNPVVAVLLGAFFAGETLSLRTAVAAAVIVGSVALVITAQQAKEKMPLLSRPQLHKRSGSS